MRVIVIFFNEPRTDFLVVGPIREDKIDAAMAYERARRSNDAVEIVDAPMSYSPFSKD